MLNDLPVLSASFLERLSSQRNQFQFRLPAKSQATHFIDELVGFLFPIAPMHAEGPEHDRDRYIGLYNQLVRLIQPLAGKLPDTPESLADKFFINLPQLFDYLLADAQAIAENDPAAIGIEEVIGVYPGFFAIAVFRIAHSLNQLKIPLLPRLLTEYAHSRTGIDIHPAAHIGDRFFIDHGTGVVIGETAVIGNNVKIYQGVTLGASSVTKTMAQQKRHPTIQHNVVIYANATILGGKTVIGHDSVIGGNVWLTTSVKPYSVVYNRHTVDISLRGNQ